MTARNIATGALILLSIITRILGGDIANLSYILLAGYALFGRIQVIQSLALLWFFSFIGPEVTEEASQASIGRFITIGGAAFSIFWHSNKSELFNRLSIPVIGTIFVGVFVFIHSILFSIMPDVSVLKIISWTTLLVVLLSAWGGLDKTEHERLEMRLFGGLTLLMFFCLPLVFTEIGYIRNGYAFQGILDSSQSFGLTIALLASWIIGRLGEQLRHRWIHIVILIICIWLILLSATRTAGLALILSVSIGPLIFFGRRVSFYSFMNIFIFAVLFGSMIVMSFQDKISTFLFKKDNVSNVMEIGEASRGILVFPMIENIKENPFTGIGFGVASLPEKRIVNRENVFGIPTAASVEKGVTPIAILEELGIFGLFILFLWTCMMCSFFYRSGFSAFMVTSTIIFTNLGEASFFSGGGMGLLFLIVIAWAATVKRKVIPSYLTEPRSRVY